jgi:hypothetical protein
VSLSTDRHDVPRNLLLQAAPAATVIAARREDTP